MPREICTASDSPRVFSKHMRKTGLPELTNGENPKAPGFRLQTLDSSPAASLVHRAGSKDSAIAVLDAARVAKLRGRISSVGIFWKLVRFSVGYSYASSLWRKNRPCAACTALHTHMGHAGAVLSVLPLEPNTFLFDSRNPTPNICVNDKPFEGPRKSPALPRL